jgi:hypothetical protein
MRRIAIRRLPAVAPAAAFLLAATAADAAEPRSLTAPVGSTKGSVLLPYIEQGNVTTTARFLALQEALQQESR